MSENEETTLCILKEMRDTLREQSEHVSTTLQAFVDVNKESNRKYQEALAASHKAYQEAQAAYKRKMERHIEKIMLTPPWRASVFVISIAVIAACMVINIILRFTGH